MINQNQSDILKKCPGLRRIAGLLLLLLFILMYMARPGQHIWGDLDQALYINLALQANQSGELSHCWRQGNAGLAYHPFPIWIYQLFLSLTHDLIKIRFVKALISLVLCLAGLYYFSRVLAYPGWVVALFCFSPFCYLYNFELTDDSWLVPISLMTFFCYAWFSKKRTLTALAGLLLFAVLSVFFHPRGGVLFLTATITLLILDRQWLKQHIVAMVLILAAVALIIVPYLMHGMMPHPAGGFPLSPVSMKARAAGFLSALASGSLFFSYDFFQLVIPFKHLGQPLTGIARVLIGITMIGYLLVFIGMGLTVARLIKVTGSGAALTLEDRLGFMALTAVIVFSAVIAFLNIFNTVEYYSIIWFSFFFFIWRAIKTLGSRKYLKLLPGAYVFSMAVSWTCLWCFIFCGGFGLTLANAVNVAQQLSRYSPQSRIVQSVNRKYGNLADIMNNNLEKSFGNVWYYKKYVGSLNRSELMQNCLRGDYLYTTLVPLLNICYAGKDSARLPVKTILLNYQDDLNKDRLTVKVCP